jgi:hypothetical protein
VNSYAGNYLVLHQSQISKSLLIALNNAKLARRLNDDRTVVEKIIASSIVESHIGKNASTTYLVEVLAAVSIAPYIQGDKLAIVSSDSINSCEQSFTFTICHYSDDSFVLLDVAF